MPRVQRRAHGVGLKLLPFLLLMAGSTRADPPMLEVDAPPEVIGDGSTMVQIVIRPGEGANGNGLTQVRLTTNAGSVGTPKQEGTAVTFPFRPPRLSGQMGAVITATALVGTRQARLTKTLKVLSAPFSPVVRSSGGPLNLRATDRMMLGRDKKVTIEARSGNKLQWFTSFGAIRERSIEGGLYRAEFEPASVVTPHAAIVAVLEPETGRFEWLPILLYGQGNMRVKTEPFATVQLTVGEVVYGPLESEGGGFVRVPIASPPGINVAQTEARDRAGNVRRSSLALGTRPFNRLLVLCPNARGKAVFLVVDPQGKPAQSAEIRASISSGTLAHAKQVGPGVFEADARVGLDHTGTLEVRAELAGEPNSKSTCSVEHASELPVGATISIQQTEFVAGTAAPVRLTVKFDYPGRLPPRKITPMLAATLGRISDLRESSPATYTANWTLPNRFGGKKAARLTLASEAGTPLKGEAALALTPGPTTRFELTSSESRILADGHATSDLTVRAFDAYGNTTRRSRLSATATGQVSNFELGSDGAFRAVYTAPHARVTGIDAIEVRDKGGTAEATVHVTLLPVRTLWHASLRAGYMNNRAKVGGPTIETSLLLRLPVFDRRTAVGVDVGYFHSERQEDSDTGEPVTTAVRSAPLLARVACWLPVDPVNVYVAGRFGVNIAELAASSSTIGTTVVSSRNLAYGGLVGGGLAAGPGSVVLEGGYLHTAYNNASMSGNLTGVHVTGGYAVDF